MTQAIFWIYSTISWIVFVIQKIELKSVILRCETSMKTCYPGHTDWNATEADKKITLKIREAAELLDMHLMDHIIITPHDGYYSFADDGLL